MRKLVGILAVAALTATACGTGDGSSAANPASTGLASFADEFTTCAPMEDRLPPFFNWDQWQTTAIAQNTIAETGEANIFDVETSTGSRRSIELSSEIADGLGRLQGDSYVVGTLDVAIWSVVVGSDDEVVFLGDCGADHTDVIATYAKLNDRTTGDVFREIAADRSGTVATELRAFSLGPPPPKWEDQAFDHRLITPEDTPEEIFEKLTPVAVAIKFPKDWISEDAILCPRVPSTGWNSCIATGASQDGHTITLTIWADSGQPIEWVLVRSTASLSDGVQIGTTPPADWEVLDQTEYLDLEFIADAGSVRDVFRDSTAKTLIANDRVAVADLGDRRTAELDAVKSEVDE